MRGDVRSLESQFWMGSDHKRRQRARQQERKQAHLEALIGAVPWERSGIHRREGEGALEPQEGHLPAPRRYFKPVPRLGALLSGASASTSNEDPEPLFWSRVPASCSPHEASLELTEMRMKAERHRQQKLDRKLLRQVHAGSITEERRLELQQERNRKPTSASDSDEIRLMGANRGVHKQLQVENFASLLMIYEHRATGPHSSEGVHQAGQLGTLFRSHAPLSSIHRVVDFGCGSGNLCLALAAYWPAIEFVFVDRNAQSLSILAQRAELAGLKNVITLEYDFSIENLLDLPLGTFEIGIGLHCCGTFTDLVMEICLHFRASCIVCPCCNGKVKGCGADVQQFRYPRSSFLSQFLTESQFVEEVSRSADDLNNYDAKCVVEADRALWALQHFDSVELYVLSPPSASPKNLVVFCHINR
jgi:SAM-dependent methyltransferase